MSDVSRETLDEEEQGFYLVTPPVRIDIDQLPASPKKIAKRAREMGWQVREWLSTGVFMPTLYLAGSKEGDANQHIAGDVRYEGFNASLYTVEGMDPETRAIGFQAHYLGKRYEDGRKASLGAFQTARVVDPVGVPRRLYADYEAIVVTAIKGELQWSLNARRDHARDMAASQHYAYNKRNARTFLTQFVFTNATEFTDWLAEWASYTNTKDIT